MDIYDRINYLLKVKNLTRIQLSQATGISYNTLSSLFARRSKNMELETAKKIAVFLDTSLEYLISGNDMFVRKNEVVTFHPVLVKYNQLNFEGKKKAEAYIDDLLASKNYSDDLAATADFKQNPSGA